MAKITFTTKDTDSGHKMTVKEISYVQDHKHISKKHNNNKKILIASVICNIIMLGYILLTTIM